MYYQEFYYWCRDAVKEIAYPPDKNRVYAELYDHMMDRYESYLAKGIDDKTAIKKTLEAMGDPKELAPQLAALHKPYWAYAMIVTRILVILLLAISLVSFAFFLNDQHYIRLNGEHLLYDPFGEEPEKQIAFVSADAEDAADGYTFRVVKAARWDNRIVVQLKVTNPRPWAQKSAAPLYMYADDSNGVNYLCHAKSGRKTAQAVFVDSKQTGLSTYCYNLYLYGNMEGVTWLKLYYDRAGREMELHIDLIGGASYE